MAGSDIVVSCHFNKIFMKTATSIILFFLFGWLYHNSLIGQPVYFNETVDLEGEWGLGMSVIADDSAYIIAAVTGPGTMISIVEEGLSGNEIGWIKKYGNSQEGWYPGNPGSFCNNSSGGFILGGSVATFDTNYGLLLRFNSALDTSFSKRYVNNINYSLILTCVKPTCEGGLIFTGELYIGGSNTDFILLKTDSLGNEMWRTVKGIGLADRGWSIVQTLDSGFVIGGFHYNPSTYHSGDPLILKFDKYGTFLWSRNLGGPYQDGKAMVCVNSDSTFTVLTAIADSIYINDFDYTRICVKKYSLDGVELWSKKYGESIGGNFVSNIRSLPDGGYICCGKQGPGNYDIYRFGWLLRLNNDGDSLWFRKYTYSEEHPYYYNGIHDVSLCEDGGFIATGEVWDNPPNSLQRIWILKVDSLGCDTAGCDTTVGVKEHGGMGAWEHRGMVVWPNPACGVLSVKVLGFGSGKDLKLDIYDIFGSTAPANLISSPQIGGGREEGMEGWMVDVMELPPGIYLAVVREETTIITSTKFVVVR
jgi:hypothetical protein